MEAIVNWIKENKWLGLGGFFFCLSLSLIVYALISIRSDKIIQGVVYGDLNLSGLTRAQAQEHLESYLEERKDNEIRLKTDVTSYKYTFDQLGFRVNTKELAEDAFKVGRDRKSLNNITVTLNHLLSPQRMDTVADTNMAKLNMLILELEEKVNRASRNAQIQVLPDDKIKVLSDRTGAKLDSKKTKEMLAALTGSEKVLSLPIDQIEAKVTNEDLAFVTGVLGTFSSDYSKSEDNRKDNIALGSSFFNEVILQPGQELSFLKTIGGINKDKGFKESGVIISGEFDRGIGGGICQVSTTMYNALIRADVEIVERHNHSRPVGYVPKGTDAAVVDGYKDLVVKNPFKTPIYLVAQADGDDLVYTVYGNLEEKNYQIEIIPESLGSISPKVVKKSSSSMYVGEEKVEKYGAKGYSYRTWRAKIVDGKEVERTLLSKSYYVPQNKVVVVGSKAKPVEKVEPSSNENNNSRNDEG